MNLLQIIQITAFSLGTVFIVRVSYKSLRSLKVHGFYRFFVFEFTLALVLINIPYWIENPFSFRQIISWILLFISLLFVVRSFYSLAKYGGSEKREDYSANFEFENTKNLVKEGIYKFIRHPMYVSLLFLSIGAMLKNISVFTVLLAMLTLIFVVITAKIEEKENIKYFGADYEKYMKGTKMFVPYLF